MWMAPTLINLNGNLDSSLESRFEIMFVSSDLREVTLSGCTAFHVKKSYVLLRISYGSKYNVLF